MEIVILANGKYPEHRIPLNVLSNADAIVCCDGAVENLAKHGFKPKAIVGDLDSLQPKYKHIYSDRLYHYPDQETNDLTKSVKWCIDKGYSNISILGATGLREDHTLGNIGLISSYARLGANVRMITDYGIIIPMLDSGRLPSFEGQKISFFSMDTSTRIYTNNLVYPLNGETVSELWMGTLNRSLGDWFELAFEPGPLVVFMGHKE